MTVQELIEELQKLPQDALVFTGKEKSFCHQIYVDHEELTKDDLSLVKDCLYFDFN